MSDTILKMRKPTLDEMEKALGVLVVALLKHRAGWSRGILERGPLISVFDSVTPRAMKITTMREDIDDPINVALKKQINRIGWWIWSETKDKDAMLEIAERVCDEDPANWSRRMSPIDSAWNGIGDEEHGYWWS